MRTLILGLPTEIAHYPRHIRGRLAATTVALILGAKSIWGMVNVAHKRHIRACLSPSRPNGTARKRTRIAATTAVLLALCAELLGCAGIRDWDTSRGRVLDAQTKEPIEDVVLVYHWKGTSGGFVASSDQCYHVETAVTDADGVFVIPAWSESFFNKQHLYLDPKWYFMAVAYKPGYRVSNLTYKNDAIQQHIVYLEKQKYQSRQDQLWDLLDLIRRSECGDVQNIRRALQSTYVQIYRQANEIAQTEREKAVLDEIKYTIVRILAYSKYPPTQQAIDTFFDPITDPPPQ